MSLLSGWTVSEKTSTVSNMYIRPSGINQSICCMCKNTKLIIMESPEISWPFWASSLRYFSLHHLGLLLLHVSYSLYDRYSLILCYNRFYSFYLSCSHYFCLSSSPVHTISVNINTNIFAKESMYMAGLVTLSVPDTFLVKNGVNNII